MNMISFLILILVGVARCTRHVLFVITDDQAYSDVGYRDTTFSTPTIDKLAKSGIILNHFCH